MVGVPTDDPPVRETNDRSLFVGREAELGTLASLVPHLRLLTLVGPGGIGKTRLVDECLRRGVDALETAVVPLEPVRSATQLGAVIAVALRVRDPEQTLSRDRIAAAIGDRSMRLVLDGAEAMADELRALAPRLLAAAPQLRIVVTSRRPLGAPDEVIWTVPSLSCPPPGDVSLDSDAVRLFLARAPSPPADREAVAELCRRLDGLPLAIELTAALTATRTVQQILAEDAAALSADGLREVLRRSYDALPEPERELIAALSVFAGDFGAADARAVGDPGDPELAHRLQMLVDASWLAVRDTDDGRRYAMLDTMRGFGRERLRSGTAEAAVRRRHAEHFAALAVQSESGLAGPELVSWTARLRAADADLQEALRWSRDTASWTVGLATAAALWRWWLVSGQLVTGREELAALLDADPRRNDVLAGRALRAAAVLAAENGEPTDAAEFAGRSLRLLQRLDEPNEAALAATILGSALRYLGEEAQARTHFETALRLRRRLGDERGEAAALNNLALLRLDAADLAGAGQLLEQALAIKRRLCEPRAIALGLCNVSEVYVRAGRLDEAARAIAEGEAVAAPLDDKQLSGGLLCNAGDLAARRGDWPAALDHYERALRVHGEAGNEHDVVVAMIGRARALHHVGRTGEALAELHRAAGTAQRTGNAQRWALAQLALAEITGTRRTSTPPGVTARQADVLSCVAAGLSNREIAERLHLSVATVERHLATVYRNLGLRGRVAAARFATDHGLLPGE